MPTPRNKPPRQDVLFSREHLRYALTRLAIIKKDAQEYAEKEIPSAKEAPPLWAVRVVRSPINKTDARKKRAVMRFLKMEMRCGTSSVQKNCPKTNKLLRSIASLLEVKPLKIMEDDTLPDDKAFSLLLSNHEFHTYPIKKSDRLLELEKLYQEKMAKEGGESLLKCMDVPCRSTASTSPPTLAELTEARRRIQPNGTTNGTSNTSLAELPGLPTAWD